MTPSVCSRSWAEVDERKVVDHLQHLDSLRSFVAAMARLLDPAP